jgi:hypothetical protein
MIADRLYIEVSRKKNLLEVQNCYHEGMKGDITLEMMNTSLRFRSCQMPHGRNIKDVREKIVIQVFSAVNGGRCLGERHQTTRERLIGEKKSS